MSIYRIHISIALDIQYAIKLYLLSLKNPGFIFSKPKVDHLIKVFTKNITQQRECASIPFNLVMIKSMWDFLHYIQFILLPGVTVPIPTTEYITLLKKYDEYINRMLRDHL